MKKIIAVLAVIFSLATGTTYADANLPAGKAVVQSFNREFKDASNVSWVKISYEIYRASFDYKGKNVRAFFSEAGNLIAVGSVIVADQLPLVVTKAIDSKYEGYEKTEPTEFTMDGETKYLVTVSNKKNTAVLEISGSGDITVFRKLKR